MPIGLTRGSAILVACVGCNAVAGLDALHFDNNVASTVVASGTGGTASSSGGAAGSGSGGGIGGQGGTGGGPSPYVAAVMADSPVAYWRLGEASGLIAVDATGNGYDGVYTGGAALGAPGAVDGDTAVSLDGIDDRVSMGDVLDFPNGAPFTLEAWVRLSALPPPSVEFGICGKRINDVNGSQGFLLRIRDDSAPELSIWRDDVEDSAHANPPVPVGVYSHLVGTYDGTTLRLYVNGALTEATATSLSLLDVPTDFDIGHDESDEYFQGYIDEVAVYNYALSDQRVVAHYLAGQ